MTGVSNPSGESPKRAYGIRKVVAPLVHVDCSGWGKLLEVAFPVSEKSSAEEQGTKIEIVVNAVDTLDAAQGGSSFRLIDQKAVGSNVVLTLAPIEPDNAKQRIDNIIDSLADHIDKQVSIAYAKVA